MDDEQRRRSLRRRILAMVVVTGLLLLVFLLRLAQFQLVDGQKYREQADSALQRAESGQTAEAEEGESGSRIQTKDSEIRK